MKDKKVIYIVTRICLQLALLKSITAKWPMWGQFILAIIVPVVFSITSMLETWDVVEEAQK